MANIAARRCLTSDYAKGKAFRADLRQSLKCTAMKLMKGLDNKIIRI